MKLKKWPNLPKFPRFTHHFVIVIQDHAHVLDLVSLAIEDAAYPSPSLMRSAQETARSLLFLLLRIELGIFTV